MAILFYTCQFFFSLSNRFFAFFHCDFFYITCMKQGDEFHFLIVMQRDSAKPPCTCQLGHLCNLFSCISSFKSLRRDQMIEISLKPSDRSKRIIGGKQIVLTCLANQLIKFSQKV